jgi:hypothetical protein
MGDLIACCGLNCANCEAYLATQAKDEIWKEQIAEKWRQEYNAPSITVAAVACNGCNATEGPWCGHCAECNFRACAQGKGLTNCSACADYPCEELSGFLELVPVARENLEHYREQHA